MRKGQGRVFLSLGSNLGDRMGQLEAALAELQTEGIRIVRRSSFYETEPVEVAKQPDFINVVCEVETRLDPQGLLERCLAIEGRLGRKRGRRRSPRPIDIDLLFFGDTILQSERLVLPHPRLYRRNFVLVPLEEIAADFRDPVTSKSIAQLREESGDPSRIRRLDSGCSG